MCTKNFLYSPKKKSQLNKHFGFIITATYIKKRDVIKNLYKNDKTENSVLRELKKEVMIQWEPLVESVIRKYRTKITYDNLKDLKSEMYIVLSDGLEKLDFPSSKTLIQRLYSYTRLFVKKNNFKEICFSDFCYEDSDLTNEEIFSLKTGIKVNSAEHFAILNENFTLDIEKMEKVLKKIHLEEELQLIKKIIYRRKKTNKEKYDFNFLKGSIKFILLSLGSKKWTF